MYRLRKFAVLCSAAAVGCVLTVAAVAQSGLPFSGISTGGLGNAPGITFSAPSRVGVPLGTRRAFPRHGGAVPIFFGADYFGSDYAVESAPPIIINNVIPDTAADSKARVEEYAPAAPLIIEREGDHWVRRRVASVAPGESALQTRSELQPLPQRAAQPLPAMILIFLDGHRQQVGSYTIFGGALYHSTPSWAPQQKVLLSALDLMATVAANRQRGLDFRLPNSPGEVVVRP